MTSSSNGRNSPSAPPAPDPHSNTTISSPPSQRYSSFGTGPTLPTQPQSQGYGYSGSGPTPPPQPLGYSSFSSGPTPPPQPPGYGSGPTPPSHGYGSFGPGLNQLAQGYGSFTPPAQGYGSFGSGPTPTTPAQGYDYYPYQQQQQQNYYSSFPPGTHPDVIQSYQMVDRNQNGFIEETELQEALSFNYQKFSIRTYVFSSFFSRINLNLLPKLVIFSSIQIYCFLVQIKKTRKKLQFSCFLNFAGPKEFAQVWSCLSQWRAIFETFDRDRSGKIGALELRDALYSLGYALPPSVLQVLISKYDDGNGWRVELDFDSFVEV